MSAQRPVIRLEAQEAASIPGPQLESAASSLYESPDCLQHVCLDYISNNIEALCDVHTSETTGQSSLCFKTDDVFFHSTLSDLLLSFLSDKHKLNDVVLSLFHPHYTCLKHVRIRDTALTAKGLRLLRSHKIVELEAVGLKDVTVNDIIGCLGEWSLSNLRTLNVSQSTFMNSAKFCVVVSLSKLRNLQSLNVSNTEFNKHGLEIIAEDLPALEVLDVSNTPINDLSPLRKCRDRLKSLYMYNLRASHTEDIVPVICDLQNLRVLDVSDDFSSQPFLNLQPVKFRIEDLLMKPHSLPHLVSLDISGKEFIQEKLLLQYMEAHPFFSFLGLALTDACEFPIFTNKNAYGYNPDLLLSGEANESQIIESLRRYQKRPIYIQRSLYYLFNITQGFTEPRPDVIQMILPAMECHPKELGVQMAATACLYNLTKCEMGQKIHPRWLAVLVRLTLDAMQNFPNHQQLQKNALLTLCSDRILQDVSFDQFRCARLVMECLCSFDDASMNRMSVAICSILAAKIPTEQTSQLGAKTNYMKKLLNIVQEKMSGQAVDITMKFTLSALWNLTDESPSTCEMFLCFGGLDLFMKVLETYKKQGDDVRIQVESKVLGLINNLAEVKHLRNELMRDDVLQAVRDSLKSNHIDVSYFAAGIVSHIVTGEDVLWNVQSVSRQEILNDLREAVLNWEQPQGEMVAYRSFSPFFSLLSHTDAHEVQLWAVWAIQHVCTKHGARYCPMLVSEGGASLMHRIAVDPHTHVDVAKLANSVLSIVDFELNK